MTKTNDDGESRQTRPETQLVTAGRSRQPTTASSIRRSIHASTVLYPNAADMVAHRARYQYGRRGTPTSEALENALRELEGPECAGVSLLPSGASAIIDRAPLGLSAPATIFWSPTASTGRRAFSATAS